MKDRIHKSNAIDRINLFHKQVKQIDALINLGMLEIDIKTPIVSITPYMHLYYMKPIKGDETLLYRNFCAMLRMWINFQRAVKKGELIGMLESEDSHSPTLLHEEKIIHQQAKKEIEKNWSPFQDDEQLTIIVTGNNGHPIASVKETYSSSQISFFAPAS